MCEEFSFLINKSAIYTNVAPFLKACVSERAVTPPKAAREDSSCLAASSLYKERRGGQSNVRTNPLPYLYVTEWLEPQVEGGLCLDP